MVNKVSMKLILYLLWLSDNAKGKEIVEKFGGCRITSGRGVPAFNGYWLYDEILYVDPVKTIIVEVPDTSENFEYLSKLKQSLQHVSNRLRFTLLCRILSELHEMFWRELVPSKFFVCLE